MISKLINQKELREIHSSHMLQSKVHTYLRTSPMGVLT